MQIKRDRYSLLEDRNYTKDLQKRRPLTHLHQNTARIKESHTIPTWCYFIFFFCFVLVFRLFFVFFLSCLVQTFFFSILHLDLALNSRSS